MRTGRRKGPRPPAKGPGGCPGQGTPLFDLVSPQPPKKIRFKEVAEALLIFSGRLPPPGTECRECQADSLLGVLPLIDRLARM